ncbi:prephenate dehydratase [Staphylococcus sp. 11261D007BR]
MQLHYLGPEGTFSYLAAQQYLAHQTHPERIQLVPKNNLYEVITALESSEEVMAIVPIENAIEGIINTVADLLTRDYLCVVDEVVMKVNLALYGKQHQSVSDIHKVYSIDPAINQAQTFIRNYQFDIGIASSTVAALSYIDDTSAAIAPLGSGELYGYYSLQNHIEDSPHNMTRFLILSNNMTYKQQTGSECLFIITPNSDQPGVLMSILNTFYMLNLNLTWIASRPLKTKLGMYHFFIQAESIDQTHLEKVMTILTTLDFDVTLLGHFNTLSLS